MTSDAGASAEVDVKKSARRWWFQTTGGIIKATLVAAYSLGLLVLVGPAVREPPPKRGLCQNSLKQLGLAIQNYDSAYNAIPPIVERADPVEQTR
jgi:Protein of unknown function (DUF1559)